MRNHSKNKETVVPPILLTRTSSRFTYVLSESVFRQGMVVLLNPVCVLLSEMLYVYKSDESVAVFEILHARRDSCGVFF